MNNSICHYDFVCEMCNQTFHSDTPEDVKLAEHEERKKTIEGYDDGF